MRNEGGKMAFANYAEFKQVNEARVAVNNAMVALLAGSRIASHTLKLTEGSRQLLPQIFPRIGNIERFNLVTESAKSLLDDADSHVAAVSIPYALSVHEDFVMATIEMLRTRGTPIVVPGRRKLGPATMHETLFSAVGHSYSGTSLEIFHILREMRNSQIHEGGRANRRLIALISTVTPEAKAHWIGITGHQPSKAVDSGRVSFLLEHMFLVFAVAKQLARDVNLALQSHWSNAEWAELVVRDYCAQTSNVRNSSAWRRSLIGFARFEYGVIGLSEIDIESAARSQGQWTSPNWR